MTKRLYVLVLTLAVSLAALSRVEAETTTYPDRASFEAAISTLATVNFNGIAPSGGFVPYGQGGHFTLGGITFSSDSKTSLYITDRDYWTDCYSTGSGGGVGTAAYGNPSIFGMSLPEGVSAVGFDTNTFSNAIITITLSNGDVLTYTTTGCTSRFVGFATDAPIVSVAISTANVGVNIDDVVIGTAGCDVSITKYRQDDLRWGEDYLDHSSLKMKDQGCAVTALSMALTQAGVAVTPGALNKSMTEKEDFSGANVAWGAATRNAGLSEKLKFHVPLPGEGTGTAYLDNQVCVQHHPVIVGVDLDAKGAPGHFVLVTGKAGTDFKIADPGRNRTKLSEYGNKFALRGFVADPPGDISELDVAISTGADFILIDPVGNRTGLETTTGETIEEIFGSAYFRDGLVDDNTGIRASQVSRSALVPTPISGTYQLQIVGDILSFSTLTVKTFSQDGTPQPALSLSLITSAGSTNSVIIRVDPTGAASPSLQRVGAVKEAITAVNDSVALGLIDNRGVANSLNQKLSAAEKATGLARNNVLSAFLNELTAQTGKHVDTSVAQVLRDMVSALR